MRSCLKEIDGTYEGTPKIYLPKKYLLFLKGNWLLKVSLSRDTKSTFCSQSLMDFLLKTWNRAHSHEEKKFN